MNTVIQRGFHLAVELMLLINLASAYESESCANIKTLEIQDYYSRDIYPYYYFDYSWIDWYNTTFWGGYHLIAWQDQIPTHCWNRYTTDYTLVLSEKHPEKLELTETAQSLQGHLLSQTGVVKGNVTVNVRKCNDDILYSMDLTFLWNAYICFDRIYKHTCDSPTFSIPATKIGNSISVVKLKWSEIKLGWYDTSFDDQYYTLPLFLNVDDVNQRCFGTRSERGLYIQAVEPIEFGEWPVGYRVCLINTYDYEYFYKDNDGGIYWNNCDYHIFARSCNGKLIFDLALLAYLELDICLIRTDNVKVVPEIHHSVQTISHNNNVYNQYNPSLQYRCSFRVKESFIYEVTWYIDGDFLVKKGPTKNMDDLVLTELDLSSRLLGYEVKCSIKALQNESDVGGLAIDSENFFAGYEFSDKHISISTQGFTPLTVWKTVPTGCSYNDLSPGICEEPLTLFDTSARYDRSKRSVKTQQNTCTYGVNSLNADDHSTPQHRSKTLRAGEKWTGTESYKFDLESRDDTYQDSNMRSAQVSQNGIVSDNPTSEVQINARSFTVNKEKVCSSRVDPHMRTADGRNYEQQKEGDYILYQNIIEGIQVQERARKCFPHKYSRAVCACAVNVRAGRDLFTINRCKKPYKIKFEQCGDCGNFDVVKKNDYQYEIITPISTRISIDLLEGYGGGRNMNIFIYLKDKDFRRTVGLCGFYDNNRTNDFRSKSGQMLGGNDDYKFSESWKLDERDRENLFSFPNSKLTKLSKYTTPCFRQNSITLAKCKEANPSCSGNRKKRANDGKHLKMMHGFLESQGTFRSKRETETNITRSKAEEICNNTVMGTPAVIEFPDKLANEDLNNVIDQCIYDITETNDVSWAEAHKQALNSLAMNILNLNPIYKANNSEHVETFFKQTCINNCSNNGVCTNEGICSCNEMYRGFDCGVDIRIPPLIEEVTYSGICDAEDATNCRCFVIHTNNIFEGYRCMITTFMMSFNGSRYELRRSNNSGEYSDVFTGECCAQVERTKRSDVEGVENFIHSYDIAISNDGEHFSDISSVFVYDATCLLVISEGEINIVELKSGYCFIDDACVSQGSTHKNVEGDKCCNPQTNMYAWTDGECDQGDSDVKIAMVIGIVVGVLAAVALATAVFIYMKCCKSSNTRRKIGIQKETTHIEKIQQSKDVTAASDIQSAYDGLVDMKKRNEPVWSEVLPDIPTTGAAKPAYKRNLWNVHEDIANRETNDEERKSSSTDTRVIVPNLGGLSVCLESGIGSSTSVKFDDEQKSERCLSAVSFNVV